MGPSRGCTSPSYSVCWIKDTWRPPVPPAPADTRTDVVPPRFPSSGRQGQNCREAPASGTSQLHSAAEATKAKTSDTQRASSDFNSMFSACANPIFSRPFFLLSFRSTFIFLPHFHSVFTLCNTLLFFLSLQNFSLHHFSFHFAYPLPTLLP